MRHPHSTNSVCRICFEPVAYLRGEVVDPATKRPHECKIEPVAGSVGSTPDARTDRGRSEGAAPGTGGDARYRTSALAPDTEVYKDYHLVVLASDYDAAQARAEKAEAERDALKAALDAMDYSYREAVEALREGIPKLEAFVDELDNPMESYDAWLRRAARIVEGS